MTTKLQWFADSRSNGLSEAVANISQSPDFYAPQAEVWGEGADEVLPIDFVNHQTLTIEGGLLKVVDFDLKDLYHLCQMAEKSGKINASLSAEIERLSESAGWDFVGSNRLFAIIASEGIIYTTKSGTLNYYEL